MLKNALFFGKAGKIA